MRLHKLIPLLSSLTLGLALLLASSPGAATPRFVDPQALGSGGDTSSGGSWGASLLLQLGLGGSFDFDGGSDDASPTLGVTPVFERRFGPNFALGGEWMFLWVKSSDSDEDRDKLWLPHLRARIAFPVYKNVEVGAMLGLGVGIYLGRDEVGGNAFVFPSYRFAFGGSYAINPAVKAFADFGYLSAAFTQEIAGKDIDTEFSTLLLSVGLMAAF